MDQEEEVTGEKPNEVEEEPNEAEEQEQGSLEGVETPEIRRPSFADVAAMRAAAAGQKAGTAARGLLGGIGERIEAPSPPSDDISDLFEGPDMERDNDVYIKDLVTVEEEDVFGEGGEDMSDILEVTDEDVMGEEDVEGYEPKASVPSRTIRRSSRPTPPPSGLAGVQ